MTSFEGRLQILAFRAGYAIIALFMLFPLLVVVGTSFTSTGALQFPPENLSLIWYFEFLDSARWLGAFRNSLIIAFGTMIISTILGVMAAFGVQNASYRFKLVFEPFVLIPLVIPPVVLGVTLLMYLSQFDLQQTYIGIIMAHSLYGAPFVFFVVQATLARFDWQLKDAANDLGATPIRTFWEIVLPNVKDGIFAGALIAFILSLQEFLMALFLSGRGTVTVPVVAWGALRDQLSPLISVVSTLLIIAVILVLVPTAIMYGYERLAKQL